LLEGVNLAPRAPSNAKLSCFEAAPRAAKGSPMIRYFFVLAAVASLIAACSSSSSSGSNSLPCCKVIQEAGMATSSTCSCGGSAQGASCTISDTGSTCSIACTINGQTFTESGGTPVASCQ
jgi:hypothetical protein